MKTRNQTKAARKLSYSYLLGLLMTLLCLSLNLSAQNKYDNFLLSPKAYSNGNLKTSFGLSLTMLPREIVEEEISQVPMLELNLKYGLPNNLSLKVNLSSIYLINTASLGLNWTMDLDDLTLSFGDEVTLMYGTAKLSDYNSTTYGVLNSPNVSVGVELEEFMITFTGKANLLLSQKSQVGDLVLEKSNVNLRGYTLSVCLEKPLWGNHTVALGVRLNYSQPTYHTWMSFTTKSDMMLTPTLFMAVGI